MQSQSACIGSTQMLRLGQRAAGNCVISGFHRQIEKDVLHYLLKGKQPIIIALARGMKEKLEPELLKPLEQGRLLIITPFDNKIKRVTEQTAAIRNQMMLDLADFVTVGFVNTGGQLEELLRRSVKPVTLVCPVPLQESRKKDNARKQTISGQM